MSKRIILFIIINLFFTSCSSNFYIYEPTEKTKQIIIQDDELDEFSDEFTDDIGKNNADPFIDYNIFMTDFNDVFYIHIFDPIAQGYSYVLPKDVRKSIKYFFHNLLFPIRLSNNILQGKFTNAGEESSRFIINTTAGIFGFFDPAREYFELEACNEDFGQTLGYWGVGSGYHIVLPFFGPSNIRDILGKYPDCLVNPLYYNYERSYNLMKSNKQSLLLNTYLRINNASFHLGDYENLKQDAVDLYPFLKDVYEQQREKLIKE